MGSISGVVLAAIILTVLPEYLRNPTPIWMYALIVAAIVLAIRRRNGLKPAAWVLGAALVVELVRYAAQWASVNLADFRMIIYALLLIVMMIVRPQGLFGIHEIWDIFRRRYPKGYCARCGYDLTGNTTAVCPECGAVVASRRSVRKA
jgi:branched-chain amino acid transport system permease protein